MTLERARRWGYRLSCLANRVLVRFDRRPSQVPDHREDFYTRTYLAYIKRDIVRVFGEGTTCRVVDAGCGTGRLAVPLAMEGHSVTGIDYHRPSLNDARARAKRAGVTINLIEGDLLDTLRKSPSESASIVLCMEVLYTCPDDREIL